MGKMNTSLKWIASLIASAGLGGCASDNAGEETPVQQAETQQPVSIDIVPQYDTDPTKAIEQIRQITQFQGVPVEVFVLPEKQRDIKNITLQELKSMSAEEIYRLTPMDLLKIKENTSTENVLSNQEWKVALQKVEKYDPRDIFYLRVIVLAKQNCKIIDGGAGKNGEALYAPHDYITSYPNKFQTTAGVRYYNAMPEKKPWDQFVCIYDIKDFPSRKHYDHPVCDVYYRPNVLVPALTAIYKDEKGHVVEATLKSAYENHGLPPFIQFQSRLMNAYARCGHPLNYPNHINQSRREP